MEILRHLHWPSLYLGWVTLISGDLELQLFALGIAVGYLLLSQSVAVWRYKDI